MRTPAEWIALGFGSGLTPRAPGTAGSLLGLLIYLPLAALPLPAYLAVLGVLLGLGLWACGAAARSLGVHDHPAVVWDEVVGMLAALAGTAPEPASLLLGFALFRALDIFKPWPISWLDRRVSGGLGIMLDDLLAGTATALVLHLVARFGGFA
jgi:phosphatidylglycerophosphatase A